MNIQILLVQAENFSTSPSIYISPPINVPFLLIFKLGLIQNKTTLVAHTN